MKYLCLICADTLMEDMSEADAAQHYDDYAAFTESLRRSGQLVACNRLLPPETATTVRVRNGKTTATDGPYAETKEQLGGYFVIDAKDLNEAILIASRIPGCWHGCVEVRPIAEDPQTLAALGATAALNPPSKGCIARRDSLHMFRDMVYTFLVVFPPGFSRIVAMFVWQ